MKLFLTNGLKKVRSIYEHASFKFNSRLPMVAVLIICLICASVAVLGNVKTVKIWDGIKMYKVRTVTSDTKSIVASLNLKSNNYILENDDDGTVLVKYTFPVYITVGDKTVKFETTEKTVEDILVSAGYSVDEFDMIAPDRATKISKTTYIDYYNIDYVKGEYEQKIPYSTETTYSSKQSTTTTVKGTEGLEKIYYTAKFVNGVKTETVIDKREVLKAAVNAKKIIGTAKTRAAVVSNNTSVKTSSNTPCISTLKPATPIQLDSNGIPVNYTKHLTVQATAYTYTGHNCATGVAPQPGYIAVNPKVIPYGTKMYIVSSSGQVVYGYAVAADTGGFSKSHPNNVDLFFSTKAACTQFGRRNVEIYILP